VSFTWLNDAVIKTSSKPASGSIVEVRRITPIDERVVDFQDGSTLEERDLDNMTDQLLFVVQEANDAVSTAVSNTISKTEENTFDARGLRIVNVADPVDDQDAVTKAWVKQDLSTSVAQARDARDASRGYRDEAATLVEELVRYKVKAVTSDYTVVKADDETIFVVDAASGPVTITLPLTSVVGEFTCRVQKTDASSNPVNVDTQGADLIDGLFASEVLRNQGEGRVYSANHTAFPNVWTSDEYGTPVKVSRRDYRFTLTSGQTVISGMDDVGASFGYIIGNLDVALNGALLTPGADYVANDGMGLTLLEPANEGDELTVRVWNSFEAIPAQVTRFDYRFTLASGQAVVTGEDDYGHTLDYVQDHIDVFLNGAGLVPGVDFLAVDGESLTLTEAASEGDELLIRAWSTFEVANTYTQTEIDTKVADAVTTAVSTALSSIDLSVLYPVGSLYFNASDGTNPETLLGFGTWVPFGAGRVPIGVGTFEDSRGEVRTFAAGNEGGAYQHLLVEAEMPDHTHTGSTDAAGNHTHSVSVFTGEATGGGVPWVYHNTENSSVTTSEAGVHSHSITIDSTGGDTQHNNMQPYIAVYIWLRIV
jgi:microcystin-dependent protein